MTQNSLKLTMLIKSIEFYNAGTSILLVGSLISLMFDYTIYDKL